MPVTLYNTNLFWHHYQKDREAFCKENLPLFYSVSADRYLSSSSMLEYGISIRGMPTA